MAGAAAKEAASEGAEAGASVAAGAAGADEERVCEFLCFFFLVPLRKTSFFVCYFSFLLFFYFKNFPFHCPPSHYNVVACLL